MKIKTSIKDEVLDVLNKNYDKIQLHTDEDGKEIYIVDDWESIQEFQKLVTSSYPEFSVSNNDYYNTEIFDQFFDNWAFADQYDICDCCNKAIYTQNPYKTPDEWGNYERCEILCRDCVRENPQEYIKYLVNNPNDVNHLLEDEQLEQLGWKLQKDEFENRWYGREANPEIIMKKENIKGFDIIFQLNYENPFAVGFSLWKKVAK